MSWAEEDWTVGLTNRAQQKVKELQVQQERLVRESRQRQLQLDSTQTALNKQTLKYEGVCGELQSLQRELQAAREEAQACVSARERLGQELQVKQAQVCSLQGQLDASRTLTDNLNKEVKRLNTELEKVHSSISSSAASPMFSTPCWNIASPWDHNVGRTEDRYGHRGEGDSKAFHVRQQLQFSDTPISAPFPRQPNKNTPNRLFHQSDVSSTPSALFPWEQDAPRSAARGRPAPLVSSQPLVSNYTTGGQDRGDCGKTEELQKDTDMRSSELQSRVCTLEGELRVEAKRLRQTQDQLEQARGELSGRDQSLQRTREQLSVAHTRITQESDRASGAEQRLKQLQEELKCQRQNSETSRLHAQQRTKELEKQHQRDVLELQKERQALEKQQQQEVNKLNQEIQQARKLHNALQSQAEKVSLQKQGLETEVQALKDKLKWTEGQLQDSQKKEIQTQGKLTEALREAEAQAVILEQSRRRVGSLEEEVKRLTQELAEALRLKELQAPLQLSLAGQSFSPLTQPPHGRASAYPPSVQTHRPPTTRGEWAREATQSRSKYPKDREPGEGIESEHTPAVGSSSRELAGSPGVQREGEELGGEGTTRSYTREQKPEDPGTECPTKDPESAGSPTHCHSAPCSPRTSEVHAAEPQPHPPSKPTGPSAPEDSASLQELRQENGALRSELKDVREELQKRLEDLEAQRRAETEARTRLKQLSRKQTAQAGEREEQERERKKQREAEERERRIELEEEKAEVARLKEAVAAMEAGAEREREERDGRVREEVEHESMWVEQNLQLKKQLAEVKTVLALERDERETEKERKRLKKEETNKLTLKLAQLEAELATLRSRGEGGMKNVPESNAPLTYLTLNHDHINSNMAGRDFKLLPSPDQHRLFCESTNQLNTAVCQATQDLIKGESTATKVPQLSSKEGGTLLDLMEESLSDLEDATTESHLGFFSSSEESLLGETSEELQKGVSVSSDLAQEVERLRREKTREAGRARQYQAKLEALQNQVTRQTQQLTSAFDKQSQHITNLLGELHHKEGALLSQGAELQRYRDQLAALPAQAGVTEEGLAEEAELEKEQLKEAEERETQVKARALNHASELTTSVSPPSSGITDEASKTLAAEGIAGAVMAVLEASPLPTTTTQDTRERMEAAPADTLHERPANLTVDRQESVESEKTQEPLMKKGPDPIVNSTDTNEQGQNGGGVDLNQALMILRQENQQLKQRLQSAGMLQRDTRSVGQNTTLPSSHGKIMVSVGTQEEMGDKPTSLSREHDNVCSASGLRDLTGMQRKLIPENGGEPNAEGRGGGEVVEEEREPRTEEMRPPGPETVNQPQITSLEQQVVALQTELQALSAENQRQEEELVIWRLTANTPQNLSQDQPPCPLLGQDELADVGVCPGFNTVTVIREDELLLSCSSNRIYGRTLASRLQHCNAPEPKSEQQHPEKTSGHQEYTQEMLVDEDSDKENELSSVKPSKTKATRHQDDEKLTTRTHRSSGDTGAITKDVRAHLMFQSKATELAHKDSPEKNKPNTPRATEQVSSKDADSSLRNGSEDTRSTATQTEERTEANRAVPAVAPQLHHVHTQTEEEEQEEEELTESPPLSPTLPSRSADATLFSGSFPIPADPARLAERIRRNRSQMSAAYDDTEYEPYGLPEVVMKGFADIPSDTSCPYIVRRGLLGTAAVPLPLRDPMQIEETD